MTEQDIRGKCRVATPVERALPTDADEEQLVPTGMMNKVGMRCARPKLVVWWSAFALNEVRPSHLAAHLRGGCYGRGS